MNHLYTTRIAPSTWLRPRLAVPCRASSATGLGQAEEGVRMPTACRVRLGGARSAPSGANAFLLPDRLQGAAAAAPPTSPPLRAPAPVPSHQCKVQSSKGTVNADHCVNNRKRCAGLAHADCKPRPVGSQRSSPGAQKVPAMHACCPKPVLPVPCRSCGPELALLLPPKHRGWGLQPHFVVSWVCT